MITNPWKSLLLTLWLSAATAFVPTSIYSQQQKVVESSTQLYGAAVPPHHKESSSRRIFLGTTIGGVVTAATLFGGSLPSYAAAADNASFEVNTLESYLYKVVRVREATQQERRLIKTGKFKDIQRANVKLAVRAMVQNYRLGDNVVAASAFLKGGNAFQMKAIDVGQTALQNLQTILEYFDTGDVENIKVGSDSMAGKEALVIKGLEAAQLKLDEFLTFFPEEAVQKVKDKVKYENDLNIKEFDPTLGDIINLAPPS